MVPRWRDVRSDRSWRRRPCGTATGCLRRAGFQPCGTSRLFFAGRLLFRGTFLFSMQERRGTALLAFVFWIQEGQMIFFKNMPLTFLKNIRLFNKKDHTPARAHPNARTRLTVVESRRLGKARSPHARTRPLRARAEPTSLPSRKSAGPHAPPRARARPPEKRIAFTMSARPPTRMGKAHPKSRSLPKERSHRPRTPAHGEGFGEGFDKDERL